MDGDSKWILILSAQLFPGLFLEGGSGSGSGGWYWRIFLGSSVVAFNKSFLVDILLGQLCKAQFSDFVDRLKTQVGHWISEVTL